MSALCHQHTFGFTLLSIIHSDVPSELAIERINFLLDIVDFGQRPEPRSSKHEFWIEQFQSRTSGC